MLDRPEHPTRRPRIALCHDWLVGRRGGELVLEAIAHALNPIADLDTIYTMFDTNADIGPSINQLRRRASALNTLPASARRWLIPAYPTAVADLSRKLRTDHQSRPFDLVVSTHSAAIKAIRPPPGVPHLCYVHAPARYIWTQGRDYAGGLRGLGLSLIRPAYKAWDRRTADRVCTFLANSTHTATQVRRCYSSPAEVVFPPVRTHFFTPDDEGLRGDFWLAVGALVPYKRFDLAIRAANQARHPLHIIGSGPDAPRLRALAGPTVSFIEAKTDAQLRHAYRTAKLLIFPQMEDFGIVAVEAQACGTPVVAFAKGGSEDTVRNNITGATFQSQTVADLLDAIRRCPRHAALACREHAEKFNEDLFSDHIRAATRALVNLPAG